MIGPTTTAARIVLHLSDESPNFYIDRTFFAETTAFVVQQFYAVIGKEAFEVQTQIEVVDVKQVGATLQVEITYDQTVMYRTRFRAGGGLVSDTQIDDIIRGPFLNEEGEK